MPFISIKLNKTSKQNTSCRTVSKVKELLLKIAEAIIFHRNRLPGTAIVIVKLVDLRFPSYIGEKVEKQANRRVRCLVVVKSFINM